MSAEAVNVSVMAFKKALLNRPLGARRLSQRPGTRRGHQECITVHNQNPKPFFWTTMANDNLQKVSRANRMLS